MGHFCELLLFSKYETQFVAWQGANWDERKTSVQITEVTRIVQYKGLHCNIFRINLLHLCALTLEDKRNWLQALGSTQSELMAAQPRQRDLRSPNMGLQVAWTNLYMCKRTCRQGSASSSRAAVAHSSPCQGDEGLFRDHTLVE